MYNWYSFKQCETDLNVLNQSVMRLNYMYVTTLSLDFLISVLSRSLDPGHWQWGFYWCLTCISDYRWDRFVLLLISIDQCSTNKGTMEGSPHSYTALIRDWLHQHYLWPIHRPPCVMTGYNAWIYTCVRKYFRLLILGTCNYFIICEEILNNAKKENQENELIYFQPINI